jgi:hypothetical protein
VESYPTCVIIIHLCPLAAVTNNYSSYQVTRERERAASTSDCGDELRLLIVGIMGDNRIGSEQ